MVENRTASTPNTRRPRRAPRWAPRVDRETIRKFYEASASATLDETLIDEVATALYRRSKSILTVTEAHWHGRLPCPWCGEPVVRTREKDEVLSCRQCSWRLPWTDYFATYHKKQLVVYNAFQTFQEFARRFSEATERREKVLLVDWLIDQSHNKWRSVAVNLIEGRARELRAFLDELAEGSPRDG